MAKKTYNVGRVSVEMVADTVQYVQKLKEAEGKTKDAHSGIRKEYGKTGKQSNTTGKNIDGLNDRLQEAAKTAQLVQGPLGGVAARLTTLSSVASSSLSPVSKLAIGLSAVTTAALAGSVAAFKMASSQAEAAKETQAYAKIVGVSTQQMFEYGKAAETVSISTSKFVDITKDVTEKLGEFIDTGGGGFKDFFEQVAPQVGLTADELQRMSGPEALQAVKNAMDEANVPMKQQVFYLESIASDSSLLIPLLAEQGKELNNLTERYGNLNTVMSDGTLNAFNNVNSAIGTAGQSFVNFIGEAISPFLDGLDEMTIAVGEFFAVWTKELQVSNIAEDPFHNFTEGTKNNESALRAWKMTAQESLKVVEASIAKIENTSRTGRSGDANRKIEAERRERFNQLKANIEEATRLENEFIKNREKNNTFLSRDNREFGVASGGKAGADAMGLASIEKRNKARFRMEQQHYNDILRLEQEFQNQWLKLQEQYGINSDERALAEQQANLDILQHAYDQGLVSHEDFEKAKTQITEEHAKQRAATERATNLMAIQSFQNATSSILNSLNEMGEEGSAAYKALFLVNQAAGIANAIVSAEVGAAKALELGAIGVPLSATIRAAGYMSAGVIAGQTIAGVAHGGMDSVPSESTFLLQQGERVIQPEANKDLTKFLDTTESGGMGGTTLNYNPTINGAFDSETFAQELSKHSKQMTAQINKVQKERPSRRSR